jgi:hypothetical protein
MLIAVKFFWQSTPIKHRGVLLAAALGGYQLYHPDLVDAPT